MVKDVWCVCKQMGLNICGLVFLQDEEELMGAAFRPSYWAGTLAKANREVASQLVLDLRICVKELCFVKLYFDVFCFFVSNSEQVIQLAVLETRWQGPLDV